jgi:hypothetical protein
MAFSSGLYVGVLTRCIPSSEKKNHPIVALRQQSEPMLNIQQEIVLLEGVHAFESVFSFLTLALFFLLALWWAIMVLIGQPSIKWLAWIPIKHPSDGNQRNQRRHARGRRFGRRDRSNHYYFDPVSKADLKCDEGGKQLGSVQAFTYHMEKAHEIKVVKKKKPRKGDLKKQEQQLKKDIGY